MNDSDRNRSEGLRLAGTGLEFAGVVGLCVALGWWLDRKFDTSPWLLIVGLFISFIGTTYKLYLVGKRSMEEDRRNRQ